MFKKEKNKKNGKNGDGARSECVQARELAKRTEIE